MRYALAILVIMSMMAPANASEKCINNAAHMRALVHTDRAKREKKFLWLKPGKITKWYYEWVREDGSVVVKVEDHKLAEVYDSRPFRESNPNLAIALPALQAVMNTTVNTVTAVK